MENEKREFKGIWIPKDVWLDSNLSALEKIILMEIDSLDSEEEHCWATNEYIAKFCQCSERKVSDAITKLKELGYISILSFDGRNRILTSNIAKQTSKKCEDISEKKMRVAKISTNNTNNNIDINNTMNKDTNIIIKENTKRNDEIIFEHWNSKNIIVHRDLTEKRKKAITKALKEHSIDDIKLAIDHFEEMLHSKYEYCDYAWSLEEFLSREKGFTEFLNDGSKWLNYLNWKKKQQDEMPKTHIGTYLR